MGIVKKVQGACLLMIAAAFAIKLTSWAIAPLVPVAIGLAIVATIAAVLLRRS